ncbi:cilia- and flagella-associated protein 61-like isoform X2 [Manduca sexta]|uniref:cilia- and flagella-associated protein 61-like isoform X2 n=1 Tax=Manduca sexta TaxID=7130 RepID=UPI00118456E0|nr:cilia- and flagella-associated protein 61-like isoform X2 [Manduca sexta]
MSIFFDFEVGSSGRRFRRAVDSDKYDIELFLNRQHTDLLFGDVDIGSLIELCTLSICMINENKEVVGFMALCDHPDIPCVNPADWEIWIRNMFQKYYLSRNTLFIHFMCCDDSMTEFFLEEALISVFLNDFYLTFIVLVVPPGCPDDILMRYDTFKKRNIYRYYSKGSDDIDVNHYLYTAMRQEFCPRLTMRRAVEEDNDDIVEILDKKCPRLKELYGEYYISEIIGRHPESQRKVIVADHQEHAVGVMCLNSEVNYKKLRSIYELQPYFGLMKATPLEKEQSKRTNTLLKTFGEPIMLGQWSPFEHNMKMEESHMDDDLEASSEHLDSQPKKISKVNFRRNAAMRRSMDLIMYRQQHSDDISDNIYMNSPSMPRSPRYSFAKYLLEDDPFDYEIVNIDKKLLSVPDVVSYDLLSKTTESEERMKRNEISKPKCRRRSIFKPMKTEELEQFSYQGGPNAFIIELIGLRNDIDDRYAFDMLQAAFEVMKDYDYCIISIPSADKSFPLLQHFCFVPSRPHICCDYALYVAHRASVLGRLRVREAEFIDVPEIARMLNELDGKETLWTIENSVVNKREHLAYVLTSGLSIVGVGILEQPEHLNFIRTKFNIDPYHNHKYHYKGHGRNTGFATLKVVLAYSVFEAHFRFFARDIMRLSGSSTLIWLTGYRNKWYAHKANSMASAMIPLLPRKTEIDRSAVPDLKKTAILSKNIMAFSTWFISKKFTSVPKANIDARIVVVGASRTAKAFLNSLLFSDASSYLTFTNVTLLSKNGLPYTRHSMAVTDKMFPQRHRNTEKYLKSIPYTYYVNVVQGTMVDINKQEKYVTLLNGTKYYYDLLILLFGKQYQHPHYLQNVMERGENGKLDENPSYVRLDVPNRKDAIPQVITYDTPHNVFIINHIVEANKALKYVNNVMRSECDYKIIVYGTTIHAYCCLNTLLEMNVPAQNIVFVEPFPPEDHTKTRVPIFCNVNVDRTVREVLNNLNVTVHRAYYFQSWTVGFDCRVSHVDFVSQFQIIRVECSAFFYYGTKGIDSNAYLAIIKSGIAYDGGILIDHQFRTKDPAVYAAGTATAYCRKYFAQAYKQKYYDSYEIGEKLGAQLRNELDPLFTEKVPTFTRKSDSFSFAENTESGSTNSYSSQNTSESSTSKSSTSQNSTDESVEKLPNLKKPIVTHCTLPGGLQYLDVRPPGRKIPHYYIQSLHYNGIVMETFKDGYFKLHLNNDYIVDGITCLSLHTYPLECFKHIYGLSSLVLNNVHLRYTAKKIDDFYEFFRSPWAFFLYHDQCDELFAMVKELLPKGDCKGSTLREALRSVANKISSSSFGPETKLKIRTNFEKSPHIEAITDYVIEWLSENDAILPMYLQPWQKTYYSHDVNRNTTFIRKRRSIIKLIQAIL